MRKWKGFGGRQITENVAHREGIWEQTKHRERSAKRRDLGTDKHRERSAKRRDLGTDKTQRT